jgi:hypothetical protein
VSTNSGSLQLRTVNESLIIYNFSSDNSWNCISNVDTEEILEIWTDNDCDINTNDSSFKNEETPLKEFSYLQKFSLTFVIFPHIDWEIQFQNEFLF